MTDEELVLQAKPKARAKWKQSMQPVCYIDDGLGNTLGMSPNDFPKRAYPAIIQDAWKCAKQSLEDDRRHVA